jgi:hypothetical protein
MPGLAKCPCYSPDQSVGEEQKSDGTKRHTALARYLADDPNWQSDIGGWDADGVEWAGEYIRTHAPMSDYPLEIEQPGEATLPESFVTIRGTPDVFCGPVLFDLKGRNIDEYREQMDAYVLMRQFPLVQVHVLYATERKARTYTVYREIAETRCEAIVASMETPNPRVNDYCSWCANRTTCTAFAAISAVAAEATGMSIPSGPIEQVRDADGLSQLKMAADAVSEWAKTANAHVKEMAIKHGVLPTGYRLQQRKGHPSITDAWAAVQASGLPVEAVASSFSISLPDLAKAYAGHHQLKEKAARADVESRLGELIQRGATVHYLTPAN